MGGGYVGLEKLTALLGNSPEARVTLLASEIRDEIREMARQYPKLQLIQEPYHAVYLSDKDLVIVGHEQ